MNYGVNHTKAICIKAHMVECLTLDEVGQVEVLIFWVIFWVLVEAICGRVALLGVTTACGLGSVLRAQTRIAARNLLAIIGFLASHVLIWSGY